MKRTASGRPPREAVSGVGVGVEAPVLVHRCSDEQTLTAAARYLSPGANDSGEFCPGRPRTSRLAFGFALFAPGRDIAVQDLLTT